MGATKYAPTRRGGRWEPLKALSRAARRGRNAAASNERQGAEAEGASVASALPSPETGWRTSASACSEATYDGSPPQLVLYA